MCTEMQREGSRGHNGTEFQPRLKKLVGKGRREIHVIGIMGTGIQKEQTKKPTPTTEIKTKQNHPRKKILFKNQGKKIKGDTGGA